MQQSLTLKVAGLWSFPSDLSAVPQGALSRADNIKISRDGIAEPRRGFTFLDHAGAISSFPNASDRAAKLFFYQSKILAHYGTTLAYHDATLGWTVLPGTFSAPSGCKMRQAEANQNLYVTTNSGVYKLDSYSATPKAAGAVKALDSQAAVSASSATWLANNFRAAYRVVWGYRDANKNLVLGSPSQRESFKNTAGATKAVDLTFTVPGGVDTSWFYQVYRTAAVDCSVVDSEPQEEYGLVYEGSYVSGTTVTVTDIVPDTLRGTLLYTSTSLGGVAQANEQPPLANDLAVFRNCLWYGRTKTKQRFFLTLLGAGSPNGVQANDTLTIGSDVYTAKASETIASAQFAVASGGSASQNVRDTALSLVRVINRYSSSHYYAYYLSGPTDLPGQILIEERTIGGNAYAIVVSRATSWNIGTGTSSNDDKKNRIYYSKSQTPEAVPLANYFDVGSANSSILRILALKDSLFVLKEDGVYRISGYTSADFRVDLFDNTSNLLAAESAVVLNNQIWCLTTQGVAAISETTGVDVKSRAIESDLLKLIAVNLSTLQSTSFGVAYESEREYQLFVLSGAGDTYPTQSYAFNTFTNAWVRSTLQKQCGGVNPADNLLYFGSGTANIVDVERKSFNYSDYVDYSSTQTITAVSGTVVSISSSDTINAGDVVYQDASTFGVVQSVDPVAGTVTTKLPVAFSIASAQVLKAIPVACAWVPYALSNPGQVKQFREVAFIFLSDFNGTATVDFESDFSPGIESESIVGSNVGGWGLFGWGGTAETTLGVLWGGDNKRGPKRVLVPRNKQRCQLLTVTFNHAVGYAPWTLQGISVIGNGLSERVA